jgi:GNAT superfamily N-acetyltransferase
VPSPIDHSPDHCVSEIEQSPTVSGSRLPLSSSGNGGRRCGALPFTKRESCHGLAGVDTRLLLLISREPMQQPLAHGRVGDQAEALRGVGRQLVDRCGPSVRFHVAMALTTKPLAPATWSDFERLAGEHHGVWDGCWCLGFHEEGRPYFHTREERRALKEARVREGRAHAALVFDDGECVGWCQFGPTAELPRIHSRRAYLEGVGELPDWRITCFFVGRTHRHRGVADAALAGALEEIAGLGGGSVESYPEETSGRKVSNSFLFNGTVTMFERHGFTRQRRIGKYRWVVGRVLG